jgi:hypothetical protein
MEMMMADDLDNWRGAYRSAKALGCPFCGNAPMIVPWHGGGPRKRMIMCRDDECAIGPMHADSTEARAVAAWNRRAPHA